MHGDKIYGAMPLLRAAPCGAVARESAGARLGLGSACRLGVPVCRILAMHRFAGPAALCGARSRHGLKGIRPSSPVGERAEDTKVVIA